MQSQSNESSMHEPQLNEIVMYVTGGLLLLNALRPRYFPGLISAVVGGGILLGASRTACARMRESTEEHDEGDQSTPFSGRSTMQSSMTQSSSQPTREQFVNQANVSPDDVDEASRDSFPASDPPSHTPIHGVGGPQ